MSELGELEILMDDLIAPFRHKEREIFMNKVEKLIQRANPKGTMTLTELDRLRAETDRRLEILRQFKEAETGECAGCGKDGLHVSVHETWFDFIQSYERAKMKVEQALQEWWAQGCRE